MFDIPQTATVLHTYVQDHNQSLQHAAFLLGGRGWLLRTQRLIDDLSQPQPLDARVLREATALLSLLSLDHVHVVDSVEAACFAQIDPSDPCVADICLLTEGLAEVLAMEELPANAWADSQWECRV